MNSRNASAKLSSKPASKTSGKALAISAGDTSTVAVAKIEKHPEGGIIVNIPGNPRGFIPTSLPPALVDGVIQVDAEPAREMARRCAR